MSEAKPYLEVVTENVAEYIDSAGIAPSGAVVWDYNPDIDTLIKSNLAKLKCCICVHKPIVRNDGKGNHEADFIVTLSKSKISTHNITAMAEKVYSLLNGYQAFTGYKRNEVAGRGTASFYQIEPQGMAGGDNSYILTFKLPYSLYKFTTTN